MNIENFIYIYTINNLCKRGFFSLKLVKNMTKLETTAKVQRLRLSFADDVLSKRIGISKPTLYTRISKHNWKVSEIFLVERLT